MAGIVQMLHAPKPHYDSHAIPSFKYSHAHTRTSVKARKPLQRSRTRHHSLQARHITFPSAFPRPWHRRWRQLSHCEDYCVYSCSIWLILYILLIYLVPSVTVYQSNYGWASQWKAEDTLELGCQKSAYAHCPTDNNVNYSW